VDEAGAGLVQRVKALNMFLHDIYHGQEVVRAGVVPESHLLRNSLFRPEMKGVDVPGNVYVHIAGIDIVRVEEGTFYVLEDNLRTPSGVSYMLQNRAVMMRLFPQVFAKAHVAPVDHYSQELLRTLRSVAPTTAEGEPTVVVMTPGPHNSAYFEHTFLAEQMGVELAEGQDLFVRDNAVYMRTTWGRDGWTSFIVASTTTAWIPWPFAPTACWACPACSACTATAASPWPTPSEPAWPTTSRAIPTCPS
jgi:uncharacterized circularly permuted ATP-grasp superfamily protein